MFRLALISTVGLIAFWGLIAGAIILWG